MFGFKKKEDDGRPPSNQDIEDVKRKVLGDSHEELGDPLEKLIPTDPSDNKHVPSQPKVSEPVEENDEQDENLDESEHDSMVPYAPVFVKLEKYGDLLTELSRTDAILDELKKSIALRDQIESLHANVVGEIKKSTVLLEKHLAVINKKFRKPEAPKVDVVKVKHQPAQLERMHEELENLKRQLKELK